MRGGGRNGIETWKRAVNFGGRYLEGGQRMQQHTVLSEGGQGSFTSYTHNTAMSNVSLCVSISLSSGAHSVMAKTLSGR